MHLHALRETFTLKCIMYFSDKALPDDARVSHVQEAYDRAADDAEYDPTFCLELLKEAEGQASKFGKYALALPFIEQQMPLTQKLYGEDSEQMGIVYSNLCMCYDNNQKPERAMEMGQKAIETLVPLLGESHQLVGTAYNNMASACFNMGKLKETLDYFEKALHICEKTLGKEHANTSSTAQNLIFIHLYIAKNSTDKQKALIHLSQAKSMAKSWPISDPDIDKALHDISEALGEPISKPVSKPGFWARLFGRR